MQTPDFRRSSARLSSAGSGICDHATNTTGPEGTNFFLNLVDFKWLMAGVGWWVDLSRLQSDRAYIDECLQRALKTNSELLRQRSVELLGLRHGSDPNLDAVGEFHQSGADEYIATPAHHTSEIDRRGGPVPFA
jgi:hypothetical protein